MGLLPDIENGAIKDEPTKEPYTPPKQWGLKKEEEEFARLQNMDRKKVTKDFSDSPHLNI